MKQIVYHSGTLDDYHRQSRIAAERLDKMRAQVIADAIARGEEVTELHDEIIIHKRSEST